MEAKNETDTTNQDDVTPVNNKNNNGGPQSEQPMHESQTLPSSQPLTVTTLSQPSTSAALLELPLSPGPLITPLPSQEEKPSELVQPSTTVTLFELPPSNSLPIAPIPTLSVTDTSTLAADDETVVAFVRPDDDNKQDDLQPQEGSMENWSGKDDNLAVGPQSPKGSPPSVTANPANVTDTKKEDEKKNDRKSWGWAPWNWGKAKKEDTSSASLISAPISASSSSSSLLTPSSSSEKSSSISSIELIPNTPEGSTPSGSTWGHLGDLIGLASSTYASSYYSRGKVPPLSQMWLLSSMKKFWTGGSTAPLQRKSSSSILTSLTQSENIYLTLAFYTTFLDKFDKMKDRRFHNIVDRFITNMLAADEIQGKEFQQFLEAVKPFLSAEPFKCNTDDQFDLHLDCVEKYIMEKLYFKAYSKEDDMEKDVELFNKMSKLKFITMENLDIPRQIQQNSQTLIQMSLASEQLFNMNSHKAPGEKLLCIVKCCKLLFEALDPASGADDFLPLLIYQILTTNPPCLYSNINYISTFRRPDGMKSEGGYYFISVVAALSFIENVNASVLTIDPTVFNNALKESSLKNPPIPYEKPFQKERNFEKAQKGDDDGDWIWVKRKGTPVFFNTDTLLNASYQYTPGEPALGTSPAVPSPPSSSLESTPPSSPSASPPSTSTSSASSLLDRRQTHHDFYAEQLVERRKYFMQKDFNELTESELEEIFNDYRQLLMEKSKKNSTSNTASPIVSPQSS